MAKIWDDVHREKDWGRWPNENIVRMVMKRYGGVPDRSAIRMLDIGCGSGAHGRFLVEEGFHVDAIDGSERAVVKTIAMLNRASAPSSRWSVIVSDLMCPTIHWDAGRFDCALDICTMQCLSDSEYQSAVAGVAHSLKPGGVFISRHAAAGVAPHHDAELPLYERPADSLRQLLAPHFSRENITFGLESVTLDAAEEPMWHHLIQAVKT